MNRTTRAVGAHRLASAILASVCLLAADTAYADKSSASPPESNITRSRLTHIAHLPSFGRIAFRPPRRKTAGPVVFLIHGVYGGASHLSYRELLRVLDRRGAQVYIADLPGVGQSDKREFVRGKPIGIRKTYSTYLLSDFVDEFVRLVIKKPVVLVAESSSTMATLESTRRLGELVRDTVLLSPTGVSVQSLPPTAPQNEFYQALLANEPALDEFYQGGLLSDSNIRQIVQPGYFDQAVFRDRLLDEYRLGRTVENQKWISVAFSAGQIFGDFRSIVRGLEESRVLMIFGRNDKGVPAGAGPGDGTILLGEPDRERDFFEINDGFEYLTFDRLGQLFWKEQPRLVAETILSRNRRVRLPSSAD